MYYKNFNKASLLMATNELYAKTDGYSTYYEDTDYNF